jgi:hypothetical protein
MENDGTPREKVNVILCELFITVSSGGMGEQPKTSTKLQYLKHRGTENSTYCHGKPLSDFLTTKSL